MNHTVSLEKCASYNQDEVDKSIKKLIDNLGGILKFVKKGQKVLVKPNIVKAMPPKEAGTTHPAVVEAVIKILRNNGCEVFVGDYPFMGDSIRAMKISGIYDVCIKHDAKIALFDKKTKFIYKKGIVVKEFWLTNYFDEVDSIINVPKLKTHSQLYFTGAVKNLYSIMPGPRRGFYHLKYSSINYFANMLLDLYALIRKKVVLNIIDGVYGMEGNGPCDGNPKFAGILAASSDAVALDFVMCSLVELNVNKLPTVSHSIKRKDFMFKSKNIKVFGEKISNININPFAEPEYHTLTRMPKFVNNFKDYIFRHNDELTY